MARRARFTTCLSFLVKKKQTNKRKKKGEIDLCGCGAWNEPIDLCGKMHTMVPCETGDRIDLLRNSPVW